MLLLLTYESIVATLLKCIVSSQSPMAKISKFSVRIDYSYICNLTMMYLSYIYVLILIKSIYNYERYKKKTKKNIS